MKRVYTIFIPVHNGGEYLHQCIDSILSQTYKHFDLIILENGSTDETAEWIGKIDDTRVKVIASDSLLPIEKNWGRILDINKNEFMTILGHDDLLDSDFLETMNELIDDHPEASLFHSHFRLIDSDGNLIRSCIPMPEREEAHEYLKARLMSRRDSSTGFVIRSSYYNRIGGMPQYKNLLFSDDGYCMKMMKISYKVTTKKEILSYRFHTGSTSGKPDQMALLDAGLEYISYLDSLRENDKNISSVLDNFSPGFFNGFCREKYFSILLKANKSNRSINEFSESISKIKSLLNLLNLRFDKIQDSFSIQVMEIINRFRLRKYLYNFFIYIPLKVILIAGNMFKISVKPIQALNRLDI